MSKGLIRERFYTDGTWTVPGGVKHAIVRLIQPAQVDSGAGVPTHAAAIDINGFLWMWGNNTDGQLGDGTVTPKSSPVLVSGSLKFIQVSRGDNHSLGLTDTLDVYAWGNNANGQLGLNDVTPRSTPVIVSGGRKFIHISAGTNQSFALGTDFLAYAWGANTSGGLGDLSVTPRSSPVAVSGGNQFRTISAIRAAGGAGTGGAVAVDRFGNAYAWGGNANGQLGTNDTTPRSSPVLVVGGNTFIKVVGGANFCVGLVRNTNPADEADQRRWGSIRTWGANQNGNLGDLSTTPRSSPVSISNGGFVFSDVGACGDPSLGAHEANGFAMVGYIDDATVSGFVGGWGGNKYGQLADGTGGSVAVGASRSSHNQIFNFSQWIALGVSGAKGVIYGVWPSNNTNVKGNGITIWGNNANGQLGDGTVTSRSSPVSVLGSAFYSYNFEKVISEITVRVSPGNNVSIVMTDNVVQFGTRELGACGNRIVEVEYFV